MRYNEPHGPKKPKPTNQRNPHPPGETAPAPPARVNPNPPGAVDKVGREVNPRHVAAVEHTPYPHFNPDNLRPDPVTASVDPRLAATHVNQIVNHDFQQSRKIMDGHVAAAKQTVGDLQELYRRSSDAHYDDLRQAMLHHVPGLAGSEDPTAQTPTQLLLHSIGYTGNGMTDFNAAVNRVNDAFQQVYGHEPTPGLIMDILRTPAAGDRDHLVHLFAGVPQTPALPAGPAFAAHGVPGGAEADFQTGVRQGLEAGIREAFASFMQSGDASGFNLLMGSVGAVKVAQARRDLQAGVTGNDPQQVGELLLTTPLPLGALGDYLTAVHHAEQAGLSPYDLNGSPVDNAARLSGVITGQEFHPAAGGFGMLVTRKQQFESTSGVNAVAALQRQINANFHIGLPVTGVINSDWASALAGLDSNIRFQRINMVQKAMDAGFDASGQMTDPFSEVGVAGSYSAQAKAQIQLYLKASSSQQRMVKDYPMVQDIISALPLNSFAGGGGWSIGSQTARWLTSDAGVIPRHPGDAAAWGSAAFSIPRVGEQFLIRATTLTFAGYSGVMGSAERNVWAAEAYLPRGDDSVSQFVTALGDMTSAKGLQKHDAEYMRRLIHDAPPGFSRMVSNDPNVWQGHGDLHSAADLIGSLLLFKRFGTTGETANFARELRMLDAGKLAGNETWAALKIANRSALFRNEAKRAFEALQAGKLHKAFELMGQGRAGDFLFKREWTAAGDKIGNVERHVVENGSFERNSTVFDRVTGKVHTAENATHLDLAKAAGLNLLEHIPMPADLMEAHGFTGPQLTEAPPIARYVQLYRHAGLPAAGEDAAVGPFWSVGPGQTFASEGDRVTNALQAAENLPVQYGYASGGRDLLAGAVPAQTVHSLSELVQMGKMSLEDFRANSVIAHLRRGEVFMNRLLPTVPARSSGFWQPVQRGLGGRTPLLAPHPVAAALDTAHGALTSMLDYVDRGGWARSGVNESRLGSLLRVVNAPGYVLTPFAPGIKWGRRQLSHAGNAHDLPIAAPGFARNFYDLALQGGASVTEARALETQVAKGLANLEEGGAMQVRLAADRLRKLYPSGPQGAAIERYYTAILSRQGEWDKFLHDPETYMAEHQYAFLPAPAGVRGQPTKATISKLKKEIQHRFGVQGVPATMHHEGVPIRGVFAPGVMNREALQLSHDLGLSHFASGNGLYKLPVAATSAQDISKLAELEHALVSEYAADLPGFEGSTLHDLQQYAKHVGEMDPTATEAADKALAQIDARLKANPIVRNPNATAGMHHPLERYTAPVAHPPLEGEAARPKEMHFEPQFATEGVPYNEHPDVFRNQKMGQVVQATSGRGISQMMAEAQTPQAMDSLEALAGAAAERGGPLPTYETQLLSGMAHPAAAFGPNGALDQINRGLWRIGSRGKNLVLATDGYLGWKHIVTDTARRNLVAEGGVLQAIANRRVRADLLGALERNPELGGLYGATEQLIKYGELHYNRDLIAGGIGYDESLLSLQHVMTGDVIDNILKHDGSIGARMFKAHPNSPAVKQWVKSRSIVLANAAGYVDRIVLSGAYRAWRDGGEVGVFRFYADSPEGKRMAAEEGAPPDALARLAIKNITEIDAFEPGFLARADAMRFEGKSRGYYRDPANLSDFRQKLAKMMLRERVNIPVSGMFPEGKAAKAFWGLGNTNFDRVTNRMVGVYMKANKMNRGGLYKSTTARFLHDWTAAGVPEKDALRMAIDAGSIVTRYHMLDLADALRVEQNFRWASYFFTKHRLWTKWLMDTMRARPDLVFATRQLIGSLNRYNSGDPNATPGTIQFHLPESVYRDVNVAGVELNPLHGLKRQLYPSGNLSGGKGTIVWSLPLARLFWLNNSTYRPGLLPELASNIVGGQPWAGMLGQGNETASLSTLDSTLNVARLLVENTIHGFEHADHVDGQLGTFDRQKFRQVYARVQYGYQIAHHGQWMPAAEAIHAALMHMTITSFWDSYGFTPAYPSDHARGSAEQKIWGEYNATLDPKKREALRAKYPIIESWIGVYGTSPEQWQKSKTLWDRWNALRAAHETRQNGLLAAYQRTGDPAYLFGDQWHAEGQLYSQQIQTLMDQAHHEGATDWLRTANQDPLIRGYGALSTAMHELYPYMPKAELKSITAKMLPPEVRLAKQMQTSGYDFLASHTGQALDPETVKSFRETLAYLDRFLQGYQRFPTTAAAKLRDQYFSTVYSGWVQGYHGWLDRISKAPKDYQPFLFENLREWQNKQDHPVNVKVGNHTYAMPSPELARFTLLPSDVQQQTVQRVMLKPYAYLSNFERSLIGAPTGKSVTQGWNAYWQTQYDYIAYGRFDPNHPTKETAFSADQLAGKTLSLTPEQKLAFAQAVGTKYPGFAADYVRAMEPTWYTVKQHVDAGKFGSPQARLGWDKFLGWVSQNAIPFTPGNASSLFNMHTAYSKEVWQSWLWKGNANYEHGTPLAVIPRSVVTAGGVDRYPQGGVAYQYAAKIGETNLDFWHEFRAMLDPAQGGSPDFLGSMWSGVAP